MGKEIKGTGVDQEQKEKLNGRKIAYRFSDDPEGNFRIASISPLASDEINLFIRRELQRVDDQIKEKQDTIASISGKKRHGHHKSERQKSDDRRSSEGDINSLKAKKLALKGETNSPIILVRKDDEITGSSLSISHKESHWWSFVKDRSEILKLPPEDLKILTKAYFLRYDIRYGQPEVKSEYMRFISEMKDEDKDRLGNYLGEITRHLGS
jgi:hypothetical protein